MLLVDSKSLGQRRKRWEGAWADGTARIKQQKKAAKRAAFFGSGTH